MFGENICRIWLQSTIPRVYDGTPQSYLSRIDMGEKRYGFFIWSPAIIPEARLLIRLPGSCRTQARVNSKRGSPTHGTIPFLTYLIRTTRGLKSSGTPHHLRTVRKGSNFRMRCYQPTRTQLPVQKRLKNTPNTPKHHPKKIQIRMQTCRRLEISIHWSGRSMPPKPGSRVDARRDQGPKTELRTLASLSGGCAWTTHFSRSGLNR